MAGDPDVASAWETTGASGPLAWKARLVRGSDGVRWTLRVEGTWSGTEEREGLSQNQYTAANACRTALREVIEEHNRFLDVAG